MYASRKEWALSSLNVTVRIVSEGKEGTRIAREIQLPADLSEEQRQRLVEIANKCPIHKLLSGPITVETNLVR
jgi:putative redox protein